MALPQWQLEVLGSNSTAVSCDTAWTEAQKTFPRENPGGRGKGKKKKKVWQQKYNTLKCKTNKQTPTPTKTENPKIAGILLQKVTLRQKSQFGQSSSYGCSSYFAVQWHMTKAKQGIIPPIQHSFVFLKRQVWIFEEEENNWGNKKGVGISAIKTPTMSVFTFPPPPLWLFESSGWYLPLKEIKRGKNPKQQK